MQPSIVILAAGAGSRYGGLKQLEPVGPSGEALLEYSVFDALRSGFSRVVLVVRPENEQLFRDRLGSTMGRHAQIVYVHQRLDASVGSRSAAVRSKPWGTAEAVLSARSSVDGPFAVVNADDYYGTESWSELAAFFARSHHELSLAAVGFRASATLPASGAVSRALLTLDDLRDLTQIVELPEVWRAADRIAFRDAAGQSGILPEDALFSMNMWGFRPELFDDLQQRFDDFLASTDPDGETEFLLPDVIGSVLEEGRFRVRVLSGGDKWCGLTHHSDRPQVESFITTLVTEGCYPSQLWG